MDVLQYTAFNQQVEYQKTIREKEACYRGLVNAKLPTGGGSSEASMIKWLCETEPCLLWNPVNWEQNDGDGTVGTPKYWDEIPTGTGWTNSLKVCNPSGYWRCGYNCTWCVPNGVTCARFQLWGSGGGSGSARSYSDSPFGSTGSYASAIVKVNQGECYCLCTGCAYCCYSTSGGQGRVPGCPTYVCNATGSSNGAFCNFCAEGGDGTLHSWTGNIGKCSPWRVSTACCPDSGGCMCESGHHFCNGQVCAICQGPIQFVPGSMYNGCIACTHWTDKVNPEDTENKIIYGIRGVWPRYCYNSSKYGWSVHPPIYGFEMCTQCCPTWSSGNCCAYPYCSSWQSSCLRVPAAGGWETHSWGADGICADSGRFGMICVQWKCT